MNAGRFSERSVPRSQRSAGGESINKIVLCPEFREFRRISRVIVIVAVIWGYLALPVIAGALRIGNRTGPRIYPVGLHTDLYITGWGMAGHEGKPREHLGWRSERRPWFYGMPDRNEDVAFR